jgi:hypothetical protein
MILLMKGLIMKNKMYQVIVKHYICDVSWSELDNE